MSYSITSFKRSLPTQADLIHTGRSGLNVSRNLLNGAVNLCALITKLADITLAGCHMAGAVLTIGFGVLALEQCRAIPTSTEARKKTHNIYKEIIAKEKGISPLALHPEAQKTTALQNIFYTASKIISAFLFIECIGLCIGRKLFLEFKNDKEIIEKSKQAKIAKKRVCFALFGEIDSLYLLRSSLTQISSAAITLLTDGPVSHFLHYSGFIAYNTGMLLSTVFLSATGITFAIRGKANLYYAKKQREFIQEFRDNLQKIYEVKNKDAKQKAREIKQLLTVYCTIQKNGTVDFAGIQAEGLDAIEDDATLYQYVQKLDQGLHKKIVETEMTASLGLAMLFSGTVIAIALGMSGGSAALVSMMLFAVALLYIEVTRTISKTSSWFNNYQKELYVEPKWLAVEKSITPIQAKSIGWYLSRIPTAIPRLIHYTNKQN